MKRRDAIKLVPISIAGVTGLAAKTFGGILDGDSGKPLALRYSEMVRERLTWIRENQSESLMEGAYAIARTVENGGQCYQYSWDAGHTEADSWPDRNGEPEIFSTDYSIDRARAGDLMLASSQLTEAAELSKKDVYIIGCPSSWSGDARYPELLQDDIQEIKLRPHADLFIDKFLYFLTITVCYGRFFRWRILWAYLFSQSIQKNIQACLLADADRVLHTGQSYLVQCRRHFRSFRSNWAHDCGGGQPDFQKNRTDYIPYHHYRRNP